MCESNAYVEKNGKETMLLENVGRLTVDGDDLVLEDILGDEVRITGTIKEIDFVAHKIVIRES